MPARARVRCAHAARVRAPTRADAGLRAGCAGLPDRAPGDGRHGRAFLSRVAVPARGADRLERPVVRRPSRARLLAAVRAAGRGVRAGGLSAWLSAIAAVLLFTAARARGRAHAETAGAAAAWLFTRRRALQRGDRADAVPARDRPRGRRLGVRAARAARARRGVLALARDVGEPGGGRVPDARRGRQAARRRAARRWRRRCWLGVPALAGGIVHVAAVPRGRDRPLRRHGVLADAGHLGRAAWRCWRRAGGRCGPAALLYLAVLVGAFVVPSPFGQNALRLGVLAGPSVLALAHRRRVAVVRAGRGRRRAALPAVAARRARRRRGARRPQHRVSPSRPRRATSSTRVAKPGERVEVPLTMNHWEAADLAKVVPLARGWERQLDQKANPIFYDKRARSPPARYHDWLRENAVRWVALPNAPLDYSARAEARAARARARASSSSSTARRAGGSGRSRGTDPPASDGAKVLAAGPNWFEVDARGRPSCATATRSTGHSSDACVRRAPGGWTSIDPDRAGVVMVRARFGLERRSDPACARG